MHGATIKITLLPYSAELMVGPVKCSVSANDIFLRDERKIKVKMEEEITFFTNDLLAVQINTLYCR
jgi:hypothetical protein